ncbi:hypothetical protein L914_17395 [Phytophthora nicotianae]|uniref:EF-hand domain-containing protein n=1 Tax=Phytophthora nicotianae TaxID=4792 RepID=W2MJC9_PHYNI|nr:hypothetical protein L914_17395 [Phytophthora nicotianae]
MAGGSVFHVGEDVALYQVVVVLNALAICLLIFEAALHHLEHHVLAHNDKYQHMLKKVYRELMILGLLSFIIKLLTEVGGIDGYSGTMLAFQVADLTIFILAVTLVLQAINVLLLLRGYNKRSDRAELITTQDLVDALNSSEAASTTAKLVPTSIWSSAALTFSKYLRRAQANNIVHMIEVEPSMWLLLLGMAWAFSAVEQILEDFEVEMRYELIETLMAFAWVLVLLHILVMLYFGFCVRRLLSIAGLSKDKSVLAVNLSKIANEEANAWQNEAAESALDAMIRIHEQHEEVEHERKAQRRGLLKDDVGFQLVATCFRNTSRILNKQRSVPRQTGVMPGAPDIHLPLFSRKAWHVVVMFMTILNGFFVALLVMGAVYCFDEIYDQVGIFPVILIPVPLVLNGLFFLKTIFRDFVLICSILYIDASTLGEVVGHFSETVELRSEFATSLLQCLKGRGHSIADLDKALQSHDLQKTGFIDVDKLRTVLASFGFHLARFRLNSVVKLLFELQGTSVEYAQLVQLVTLIQQEYCVEDSFGGQRPSLQPLDATDRRHQLPLLAQSSLPLELGQSDFVFTSATTPPFERPRNQSGGPIRLDESIGRQSLLQRSASRQFAPSSSRVLHGVYNLRSSLPPLESMTNGAHSVQ